MEEMFKTANLDAYRVKINELIKTVTELEKKITTIPGVSPKLDIATNEHACFVDTVSNDTLPQLAFNFVDKKHIDELNKRIKSGTIGKKGNWYFVDDQKFLGKSAIIDYLSEQAVLGEK